MPIGVGDRRQFRQLHPVHVRRRLRSGADSTRAAGPPPTSRSGSTISPAPRKRRRANDARKFAVANRDVANSSRFVALQQAVAKATADASRVINQSYKERAAATRAVTQAAQTAAKAVEDAQKREQAAIKATVAVE